MFFRNLERRSFEDSLTGCLTTGVGGRLVTTFEAIFMSSGLAAFQVFLGLGFGLGVGFGLVFAFGLGFGFCAGLGFGAGLGVGVGSGAGAGLGVAFVDGDGGGVVTSFTRMNLGFSGLSHWLT